VTLSGLAEPGIGGWAVIAALLFVVRPLAGVLAFARSGVPMTERWFIGWFGIRGIGSFYYVAVVIGAGVLSRSEAELLYWTTIACVGVSIVLHGLTATPLARRLGLHAPTGAR
jgi:NhaP-type Na+/H+ or K+/H+ antiporter